MSASVLRSRAGAYEWRGVKMPSVTTVLGVLGKSALIQWAADEATDCALRVARETLDSDLTMTSGALVTHLTAARDEIRKAHLLTRNAAGDRGTAIHEIADMLAGGKAVARDAVPEDLRPHFDGLALFFSEHAVETLWSERTVVSEYGYAGSLDRLAQLDGAMRVIDFKTRASIDKCTLYPEVRLQTAAYARATCAIGLDGTEEPIPATAGGALVSIYPGGYVLDLIDDPDGADFEAFLRCLDLYQWTQAHQPPRAKRARKETT